MNIGVGILFICLGIFIFLYGGSAESGIEKAQQMIGK
jgi:hypothetical protein